MLAVDLDGTLLGPNGIDPVDLASLHDASDAGVEVVVATGRSWIESKRALQQIDVPGVTVAAGGALLHDTQSGVTLDRFVVEEDVIQSIAAPLLADGHVVHMLQDHHGAGFDYWMVGTGDVDAATEWWMGEHSLTVQWVETMDDVDHFTDTVRVGTVGASSQLAHRATELSAMLGDRVNLQHWAAVVESEVTGKTTHLFEAFHPHVDKWTMLERLMKERKIEAHQVAAIGDGLNDVGMLRGAGLGIAMEGALPNVHAAANSTTGPLGGGGVAQAVKVMLESVTGRVDS